MEFIAGFSLGVMLGFVLLFVFVNMLNQKSKNDK